MSTSEACAACGCNIKQSASSRGKPTTVGAKTYCGECAKLIINDPKKKDSNVKLAARTPAAVGAGVGGGADDDDWFKPKREPEVNSKARPGGSNRIAAIGSSRSPKGSGRMEAPKPSTSAKASGLQAKSSGLAKATSAQDEKKKGSRVNLAAASGRTPLKSSKSLAPASKLTEKVIDPVKPAESEEKAEALEVDKPKRNSSRRLATATSTRAGGSRQSVRSSGRGKDKDESSDRSSRSRAAGAGGGMSPGMMIGIGIGAVVLLLFGALAMKSGGGSKKKDVKTVEKAIDYGDKTPSHVWAQRAEEKKARGDRLGAADDFGKAAEAAEREGSGRTAETYSMKAYDLRKFTVLNEAKGR